MKRFIPFLLIALLALVVACQQDTEPAQEFALTEAFGQTTYRTSAEERWQPAWAGLKLGNGGQVRTAANASILLQTGDQTEIEDHHASPRCHQYVGGLQVAVQLASLM